MAIFGEDSPQFVYGGATVELDYAVPLRDEPIYDTIAHQSAIGGDDQYSHRGYKWAYEVVINLMKYTNPDDKFSEIVQYLGLNVSLYRHRDHQPFQDSNGDDVPFYFSECVPFYTNLEEFDTRDKLLLKFVSTKYIDISQSLTAIET